MMIYFYFNHAREDVGVFNFRLFKRPRISYYVHENNSLKLVNYIVTILVFLQITMT